MKRGGKNGDKFELFSHVTDILLNSLTSSSVGSFIVCNSQRISMLTGANNYSVICFNRDIRQFKRRINEHN